MRFESKVREKPEDLRRIGSDAERNLHRTLLTLSRKEYEFNSQFRRLGSENGDAQERAAFRSLTCSARSHKGHLGQHYHDHLVPLIHRTDAAITTNAAAKVR